MPHLKQNLTRRSSIHLALSYLFACITYFATASHAESSLKVAATGKFIRSITIVINDVFEGEELNLLYRSANNLKINTRPEVVRRELLFKEGDVYDPFIAGESERALRALRYLRNVTIVPIRIDGDYVDLQVQVQDTWTLIPQLGYSSGVGRNTTSAGIAESNLGGYGKRAELLFQEEGNRRTVEGVYDDPRVWGTYNRFLAAYFDRTDGERQVLFYGRPFRSLVERNAWSISLDRSDTVGRLFKDGRERFIYRDMRSDLSTRYSFAQGNPEIHVQRYSFGYDFQEDGFHQATPDDYDALNLDPTEVRPNRRLLAKNRRFTGPTFSFQSIEPEFVSLNYVDRFDRVEDYNLGRVYSLNFLFAPTSLGSSQDALLFSGYRTGGTMLSESSFIRAEGAISYRLESNGLKDALARFETKYYNMLGDCFLADLDLGKHTLAGSFFIDYGYHLDRDRELLAGGDNLIRGYKARTLSGDKRIGLNIEDRVHLIDDLFRLVSVGGALFADVGGATHDPFESLIQHHIYSDVGVGLRLGFPRSSGGNVVRADLAFPLRDGPDGSNSMELRIIFAGGQLFDAHVQSESLGRERATLAVGKDR